MNAIPTTYNGVNMRSRLEAKWAAFFDLLGWGWEYEPIDLDGYIPDFALKFYKPLLVECKPVLSLDGFEEFRHKLKQSGWKDEILIVGAALFPGSVIGELREINCGYDSAQMVWCIKCGRHSIIHSSGGWQCRVCGAYDGKHHFELVEDQEIEHIWRQAGNTVQYQHT